MSFGLVSTVPVYLGVTPSRALTQTGAYSAAADSYAAYVTSFAPSWNVSVAQINAFIAELQSFTLINPTYGTATSTSNVTIPGVIGGNVSFTVAEDNRLFPAGSFVLAAVTASPTTNYMQIQVTAWDSGTKILTGKVTQILGPGAFVGWTLSPSAPMPAPALTTGGATEAGSVVLTNGSGFAHKNVFTAHGQGWQLPDATTMPSTGEVFALTNASEFFAKITDSAGTLRAFAAPGQTVRIGLTSAGHATNNWTFAGSTLFGITASLEVVSGITLTSALTMQVVALDANRRLVVIGCTNNGNIYGVVYDASTQTWGSVTALSTIATGSFIITPVSANSAILTFTLSTGLNRVQGCALSIAGTTITTGANVTVGTANGITLQSAVLVGTTVCLAYSDGTVTKIVAFSAAGTVASVGAAVTFNALSAVSCHLYASGAVLIALGGAANGTVSGTPYSVAGTTLTVGTASGTAAGLPTAIRTVQVGANAWAILVGDAGGAATRLAYVTLAGTVCTLSAVAVHATVQFTPATQADMAVVNGRVLVVMNNGTNAAYSLVSFAGTVASPSNGSLVMNTLPSGIGQPVVLPVPSGNIARCLLIGTASVRTLSFDCTNAVPVVAQRHIRGGQDIALPVTSNPLRGARDAFTFLSNANVVTLPAWVSGAYNKRNSALMSGPNREYAYVHDMLLCGSIGSAVSNAESWIGSDLATTEAGNNTVFIQRVEVAQP